MSTLYGERREVITSDGSTDPGRVGYRYREHCTYSDSGHAPVHYNNRASRFALFADLPAGRIGSRDMHQVAFETALLADFLKKPPDSLGLDRFPR